MSQGTFKIFKNQTVLVSQIDESIALSNTYHRKSTAELCAAFVRHLCLAQCAWLAIIDSLRGIAIEIPQKAYAAEIWEREYTRLATRISQALAMMVNGEYAKGRNILEQEYIPLQNIYTQVKNSLYMYDHSS